MEHAVVLLCLVVFGHLVNASVNYARDRMWRSAVFNAFLASVAGAVGAMLIVR